MKQVQFSVVYPEGLLHPIHRRIVAESEVSRAELLAWSPTVDATTLLWCGGDRPATERVVSALDSLRASEFVAGTEGTYAVLRQDDYEFADAILEVVADSTVIFRPPVAFLDSGAVRFEAVGESDALGTFHDALSELGTVTVERVEAFERAGPTSVLTARQAEALSAAVDAGYYEVPREGTVADVAAALGCSSSTAGELLRKAEAAVIRRQVGPR